MIRRLSVALAVTALVALAVGVASAHKVSYRTKTTFEAKRISQPKPDPGTPGGPPIKRYNGKVTSPDNETRCIRNRLVIVTHDGFEVGRARTTNGGAWEIAPEVDPPKGDEIVATVKRKQTGSLPNHRHVCKSAQATAKAP